MANPKDNCETELASELLHFTSKLDQLDTPTDVLDGLHKITTRTCQLGVLGALLFPARWGDWGGIEKEKTVFLHKSLPEKWWDEYVEMSRKDPAPGAMMARLALAPFTMTETMRMLEPVGLDRWPQELALKYGIRDHSHLSGGRSVGCCLLVEKCAVRAALAKGSRSLYLWARLSVLFVCRRSSVPSLSVLVRENR